MSGREKPILFSGPMVWAIIEGRKTQTRRVVKPQPSKDWWPTVEHYCPTLIDRHGNEYPGPEIFGASDESEGRPCPYGPPGDRLWVRETHLAVGGKESKNPRVVYRASNDGDDAWLSPIWTPSIFMPRRFSRLTLEVKSVRVERLREISEADAFAEGISGGDWLGNPVGTFRDLWDSINAKRGHSWKSNPWVWVIEFELVNP